MSRANSSGFYRWIFVISALSLFGACSEPKRAAQSPATNASTAPQAADTRIAADPPSAAQPAASGQLAAPPTFSYTETQDRLEFWAPVSLRLTRAQDGKVCSSELAGGGGNMWTGPDVEAALADAGVQGALASGARQYYLAPTLNEGMRIPPVTDDPTEGVLTTPRGSIEWKRAPCAECVAEPRGVALLHRLLLGVMRNRRAMC